MDDENKNGIWFIPDGKPTILTGKQYHDLMMLNLTPGAKLDFKSETEEEAKLLFNEITNIFNGRT